MVETIIQEALEKNPVPEFRSFEKPAPKLTRISVPPLRREEGSRLVLRGGLAERYFGWGGCVESSVGTRHLPAADPRAGVGGFHGARHERSLTGRVRARAGRYRGNGIGVKEIRFNAITNSTAYASGELVFQWHTDPASVTNVKERFPR